MFKKIDRNYISDIDKLLQNFDETHCKKSSSQQIEIAKHQRVADLRDNIKKVQPQDDQDIWEEF